MSEDKSMLIKKLGEALTNIPAEKIIYLCGYMNAVGDMYPSSEVAHDSSDNEKRTSR